MGTPLRGLALALGLALIVLAVLSAIPGRSPFLSGPGTGAMDRSVYADQNGSSSGSSTGYGYCPSTGPTVLGIEWSCVAVLNLTEVLLIFAGIGIILFVFRDSRAAELPGEDGYVPLTEEDWASHQARRRARLDPEPPQGPDGGAP